MPRLITLCFCLSLLVGCNVVVTTTAPEPVTSTATAPGEEGLLSEQHFEVPGAVATENVLQVLVTYLAFFAEICGVIVIGVATIRAFVRYLPHIFGLARSDKEYQENIRLRLGKSLALALEFALGADILRTAVAPTIESVALVGAIVALRTILNYFLEREIRQVEERHVAERRGTEVAQSAEHRA